MASTNFIDKTTVVPTAWLNEVNGTVWTLFGAASTASDGRTALGLGTMATQNANSVAITGGTILGLSSPIPVASGGTGSNNSTGSGAVVLQNNPTLNSAGVSGLFSTSSNSGGDFVLFINTASAAEAAVRVDATQTTSGASLKLSNSGLNKQVSLRVNNTGGFNLYVNQTAGGSSTSGQNAFLVDASGNLAFNGTVNTSGSLSENGTRVVSRNSAYTSGLTSLSSTSGLWVTGFSTAAFLYQVFIQCTSADANYNVGTVINLSASNFSGGTFTTAIDPGVPGTIVWRLTGGITLADGVLGTPTAFTLSKWSVFVRAWQ